MYHVAILWQRVYNTSSPVQQEPLEAKNNEKRTKDSKVRKQESKKGKKATRAHCQSAMQKWDDAKGFARADGSQ
jgi:hypothetical protein